MQLASVGSLRSFLCIGARGLPQKRKEKKEPRADSTCRPSLLHTEHLSRRREPRSHSGPERRGTRERLQAHGPVAQQRLVPSRRLRMHRSTRPISTPEHTEAHQSIKHAFTPPSVFRGHPFKSHYNTLKMVSRRGQAQAFSPAYLACLGVCQERRCELAAHEHSANSTRRSIPHRPEEQVAHYAAKILAASAGAGCWHQGHCKGVEKIRGQQLRTGL